MEWTTEGLVRLVEVVLSGGVALILRDIVGHMLRKNAEASPTAQRMTEQGIAEKTLLNVARANDELTDDVTRLREVTHDLESRSRLREEWWQTRWDAREVAWSKREAELQAEVDRMRQQMLNLIGELDDLKVRLRTGTE